MDLNNLKNTVSNLTLYDLKAGVRQLQNGALPVQTLWEWTA
jgi:epsin